MKILCSGFLIRYPLGGHVWHDFQYLLGFHRLGHEVRYFEDFGWPGSCYDPLRDEVGAEPVHGIAGLNRLLQSHDFDLPWSYLAEDGETRGESREALADYCRSCDLFVNIGDVNWIPELSECRRRVLVDTDPVFTQIGAHGLGGPPDRYHALLTYGENVHKPECGMPAGGGRWQPTRQPVVLEATHADQGDSGAAFTTVMNWSAYGEHEHDGQIYGQKNREFEPFFSLPAATGENMEIALSAPEEVRSRLAEGGWHIADPLTATKDVSAYRNYVSRSRAEFSVAKHAYVTTRSGWFSDRSAAYLASGRPVVVQDTGFSDFLPCGKGLLAFSNPEQAIAGIRDVRHRYEEHCRAARAIVEEYFDSRRVLNDLLERSL